MTTNPPPKKTLGRGLSSLLGDDPGYLYIKPNTEGASENIKASSPGQEGERLYMIPLDQLEKGRYQPRRSFDQEKLNELTASVRKHGVLQPIIIYKKKGTDSKYEVAAGERRLRASELAGLQTIPAIIRDYDDAKILEIAIIENVQRQELNPMEEAEGYQRLLDEFQHTQEELSIKIGKSRSYIANTLRLVQLPLGVQQMLREGQLTAGHARTLINMENALDVAHQIVDEGLNVRQTEKLVRKMNGHSARESRKDYGPLDPHPEDQDMDILMGMIQDAYKIRVELSRQGPYKVLSFMCKDTLELDFLIEKLMEKK